MDDREASGPKGPNAAAAAGETWDRVVSHRGEPLLVLGGPGSGKTAALERRYLDLAIKEVAPHRILLLYSHRPGTVGEWCASC